MLYGPSGEIAVSPEHRELDQKLRTGDGVAWPGDIRLWLGIGVIECSDGRVGRRLEVWRDNEDGSTTLVGHWKMDEQIRVLYDLVRMRVDSPGHVPVADRIDAHNEAHEAKLSAEFQDTMGEFLDHALRLGHDLNEPRNKFYMNGGDGARA